MTGYMTYWKDVDWTGIGLIQETVREFPWRNWEESWKSRCIMTDLQVSTGCVCKKYAASPPNHCIFHIETNTRAGSLLLSLTVLILYTSVPGFQRQTKFKSKGRPRGTLSPVRWQIIFLLLSTKFWEAANSFWLSTNFLFPAVKRQKVTSEKTRCHLPKDLDLKTCANRPSIRGTIPTQNWVYIA